MTQVAASAWWIENLWSGHHEPNRAVKISNASCGVRRTVTAFRTGSTYGPMSSTFATLRLLPERLERLAPELVEVTPELDEPFHFHLVDPPRSFFARSDESGAFEHLEVLRDRRPRDPQSLRQLADGLRSLAQLLEDLQPGRVRQRRQCLSVSHN